jgi:hypothetical protein
VRSYAVEGTVFWLVVSAIIMTASAYDAEQLGLVAAAAGVAIVYLVVAYACWNLKKWGFIAAIALALFTAVSNITFGSFFFAEEVPSDWLFVTFVNGGFLMVPQYILMFFSFRAYRELGQGAPEPRGS